MESNTDARQFVHATFIEQEVRIAFDGPDGYHIAQARTAALGLNAVTRALLAHSAEECDDESGRPYSPLIVEGLLCAQLALAHNISCALEAFSCESWHKRGAVKATPANSTEVRHG